MAGQRSVRPVARCRGTRQSWRTSLPDDFRDDPGCRHPTCAPRFTAGQLPTVNWSILTSHRFLVLAAAGLFTAGTWFDAFQSPERAVYALFSKALPAGEVSSAVAVVAIDDAAIKGIGSWPWPRDRIAATIDRLRRFEVRAIGIMPALIRRSNPPGACRSCCRCDEVRSQAVAHASSKLGNPTRQRRRFGPSHRAKQGRVMCSPPSLH